MKYNYYLGSELQGLQDYICQAQCPPGYEEVYGEVDDDSWLGERCNEVYDAMSRGHCAGADYAFKNRHDPRFSPRFIYPCDEWSAWVGSIIKFATKDRAEHGILVPFPKIPTQYQIFSVKGES